MLELRLALLTEKLGGPDPLPTFAADPDPAVRAAVELLQQQRAGAGALATLYANMPARLFLDGQEVLQAGHPEKPVAALLPLTPGRHQLAIQTPRQAYPDWVQLALRHHDQFFGTDPAWKFAFNPPGDWASPAYDDSAWRLCGGTGVKGPPEEPHVWVEPDPWLDMQSRAIGIRPQGDWPGQGGVVVYRQTIEVREK